MSNLPNHVVVIPDGNTRWAKANNLAVFAGYREGVERGLEIMQRSREVGINTLTFWGLSTENWRNRPEGELDFLVSLFIEMIDRYAEEAKEHQVRVRHLGNKNNLPKKLIDKIYEVVDLTKDYQKHNLNLALDYGGQDEIIRATKAIVKDVSSGKISVDDLSKPIDSGGDSPIPQTIYSQYLDSKDQPYPYPDFIIRTSGEVRTSGFMPWQSVYSELFFEPAFWPDFTADKFDQALEVYTKRQRRFGGGHNEEDSSEGAN
ncbi:MAG: polyprenyl diphosphate synthase [Candidatus Saccharimonadales bacterium]